MTLAGGAPPEEAAGVPVYAAAAVREADRLAVERFGIPGATLMERAGRGAFAAALERFPGAFRGRVVVLAGRGNNGGDGFVFARWALRAGARVTVGLLADAAGLKGDAAAARDAALAAGVELVALGEEPDASVVAGLLAGAGLAVDALLGTGTRGAPRGGHAAAIRALNAWRQRTGGPVVALDLPSGLDPDTGIPSEPCVRADLTAVFGALKAGVVSGPALPYVGEVHLIEIGLPAACLPEPAARLVRPRDVLPGLPAVDPDAHKGRRGRVWVLGGARGMTGAAILAARAALRGGAGLIHVAVPAGERPIVAAAIPEALTLGLPDLPDGGPAPGAWDELAPRMEGADACVVGPGLGRTAGARALALRAWAAIRTPAVFDADALFALADVAARGDLPPAAGPRVITPHAGEAALLLATDVAAVQTDRLAAARALAERFGAVAVLKGARTVVAVPGEIPLINATGSPALATGGSGDVLAGLIAALLARGAVPLPAAAAGAFLHGWAGQRLAARLGPTGVLAGDLPAEFGPAEAELRARAGRDRAWEAALLRSCGLAGVVP